MTDTPDGILDRINLQLVAGSDEVVLSRADAGILACLLHDLLGVPRDGDDNGGCLKGLPGMTAETTTALLPTDPDTELIETVAETLYRTDWPSDMWDGLSVEAYREVARAALTAIHDALLVAVPQWQPVEYGQIRAGMRIRATVPREERTSIYIGVAHHTDLNSEWQTEHGWPLADRGWGDSVTYEVDPSTIPADPGADLVEALREASWRIEHMGGRPDPLPGLPEARDLLNKLRELGWTVTRESEATA